MRTVTVFVLVLVLFLAASAFAAKEYKVVTMAMFSVTADKQEAKLNELAADGWRLVEVIVNQGNNTLLYLERETPAP